MIGYLTGKIIEISERGAVVLAGNVGYRVLVPGSLLARLQVAANAELYTSLISRENDLSLYGFSKPEERRFFEELIKISGIGPGLALRLMGRYVLPELLQAIRSQNVGLLEAIPGIGRKTAQRVIVELAQSVDGLQAATVSGVVRHVQEALQHMGYTQKEILQLTAGLPVDGTPEQLLRQALQKKV